MELTYLVYHSLHLQTHIIIVCIGNCLWGSQKAKLEVIGTCLPRHRLLYSGAAESPDPIFCLTVECMFFLGYVFWFLDNSLACLWLSKTCLFTVISYCIQRMPILHGSKHAVFNVTFNVPLTLQGFVSLRRITK